MKTRPANPFRFLAAAARLSLGLLALTSSTGLHALPQDGTLSNGSGSILAGSSAMTVQQNSSRLTIDWRRFDVGAGEHLRFRQPGPSAIVLNRVLGQQPSRIMGSLSANGQVFLSNPNGILFGPAAQVNVAGLAAAAGTLSDPDFAAGNFHFSATNAAAAVVNQGALSAADRGYIALLAPQVINQGIISARLGTALLAAADQVTLKIGDNHLLGYTIHRGAVEALADNRQLIKADGGSVFMVASAADRLASAVVNNDGVVEALNVDNHAGVIRLMGDMSTGRITGNGRLDASAPNSGDGGAIETSAAQVTLGSHASVSAAAPFGKAGSWLIDPRDYLLNLNSQTQDGSATTVLKALASTDVTISTSSPGTDRGVITVDGQLQWGNGHTLTLIADTDIVLTPNTQMTMATVNPLTSAFSYGNLVLKAGFGGTGSGTLVMGPGAFITLGGNADLPSAQPFGNVTLYYTPASYAAPQLPGVERIFARTLNVWLTLSNSQQLQAMNSSTVALASNFALVGDINASAIANWNNGAGFTPVGTTAAPFTGKFDGMGHTITGLTINRPGNNFGSAAGLFGAINNASISNLGLLDATVIGGSGPTGALAGMASMSEISNTYVSAASSVSSQASLGTGGLVGFFSGTMERVYSDAAVSGGNSSGGLVGLNLGAITQAYSTGAVKGGDGVGGLVGSNGGQIDTAYSIAAVSAQKNAGGLVGVTGGASAGNPAQLKNSYAQNTVKGSSNVAGLAGSVVGNTVLENLFWDTGLSGLARAAGETTGTANTESNVRGLGSSVMLGGVPALGLSTADWLAYAGHTAPLLKTFLTPVTAVYQAAVNKEYSATAVTAEVLRAGISYLDSHGLNDETAGLSANIFYGLGSAATIQNAGSYVLTPDLWSNQKGYAITLPQSPETISLIINPRNLGLVPTAIQKEYDGSTAAGSLVNADKLLPGHTLQATQSLNSADVNLATSDLRTLTVDNGARIFSGSEDVTANYFIQRRPLTSSSTRITPKAVTITANNDSRQAGGVPYAGGNGITYSGLVGAQGMEVFLGQLRYGGTSQGASLAGTYSIVPAGLSAKNYVITYVDGELVLRNPVAFSAIPRALADAIEDGNAEMERAGGSIETPIDAQENAYPFSRRHSGFSARKPILNIIENGSRMP